MAITGIKRITVQTTEGKMTTASNEERLARLEAGQEHLATKADLAALEDRLVKWMVGLMLGAVVAATAIATLIERIT
ncbi:MAG: hypothetical protein F4X66_13470 [Chloroflexi bacterium]|nr:hypothetical protein [Chloroflexota bacterium]MYE41005.1 hypothetical protein [Chloroflexota bacterium]